MFRQEFRRWSFLDLASCLPDSEFCPLMAFALLRRELLVQGRERRTYWFRVLMVGLGVLVFTWLWVVQSMAVGAGRSGLRPNEVAAWILGSVHGGMMLILSLGGALLTADCLARERREGTLGLLFLTPLGAGDIALGKCASQLLRLFGFWLSVLPLMAIPLLLGGVTPRNLIDALLAESAAALTGMAAGFLATAYCRRWGAALFMAMVWLVAFYVSHGVITWAVGFVKIVLVQSKSLDGYFLMMLPAMPLIVGIGLPLEGPMGLGPGAAEVSLGREMLLWMAGWSLLLFTTVMLLLYGVLARVKEEAPAATPRSTRKTLATGRADGHAATGILGQRVARRTGRFPYYSLETRTALFGWGSGWLAGGTSLVWLLAWAKRPNENWWFVLGFTLPALLLLAAVVMAGASFHREREEGVLEMLLATPLTPRDFVWGRLGSIARALGPALLLGLFWMGLVMQHHQDFSDFSSYFLLVVPAGLAGMALAFWVAVRGWGPLMAAGFGLGMGIALPHMVLGVGWTFLEWLRVDLRSFSRDTRQFLWLGSLILYQLAVTVGCLRSVLVGFRECTTSARTFRWRWFTRSSQ